MRKSIKQFLKSTLLILAIKLSGQYTKFIIKMCAQGAATDVHQLQQRRENAECDQEAPGEWSVFPHSL